MTPRVAAPDVAPPSANIAKLKAYVSLLYVIPVALWSTTFDDLLKFVDKANHIANMKILLHLEEKEKGIIAFLIIS